MQRTKHPTFWPTLKFWHAASGDLPQVVVPADVRRVEIDGAPHLEVRYHDDPDDTQLVDLPIDFVLREVLEADPADVLTLTAQWGPLWHAGDAPSIPEDDALERLRTLQRLARHYLAAAHRDADELLRVWEDVADPPTTLKGAWWQWADTINEALVPFQPVVTIDEDYRDVVEVTMPWRVSTYDVAVLQLARMATEGRTVLRCANERCGREFTRQRTSSRERRKYGDERVHATGIRYCSRECAKAQSERERRARRREMKGGA